MNKLRILMWHLQGGGVGEYRFHIPARALTRAGHQVTHFPQYANAYEQYETVPLNIWQQEMLNLASEHDIIHTQYTNSTSAMEAMIAVRGYTHSPYAVDIDDDIINVPEYNMAYRTHHEGSPERRVQLMSLRSADALAISTVPLKEVLSAYNDCATQLDNFHDPFEWEELSTDPRRADDHSIRLMFAAGAGRLGDLDVCKEAITDAMARYPQLRLIFLSMIPDWAAEWMASKDDPSANRCFYIRGCDFPTYRAALRWLQPDIFFAPVLSNTFNRSKSCIKAYDAAEAGAALLCSDFDTYSLVPDNAAYKVADDEWADGLDALITSATLRNDLNTRLKYWARTTRHIDNNIHHWVDFYERTIARPALSHEELRHALQSHAASK